MRYCNPLIILVPIIVTMATAALSTAAPVISSYSFADIESELVNGQNATTVKYEEYVSNPQPGGSVITAGVVASFANPFTGFVSPSADNTVVIPLPDSVGVVAEGSTGDSVSFEDWASSPVLSDIRGPNGGNTVTFKFVHPVDPSVKGAVSRVGFRFGSVGGGPTVAFYDPDDNLIALDTPGVGNVPTGGNVNAGYIAEDGGSEVSAIHKVVFTETHASDVWLIGSFTDSSTNDIAYNGFTYEAPNPRIEDMSFSDVQGAPGATAFRFDRYVSNPQPGSGPVDQGTVKLFTSPCEALISPDAAYTEVTPLPDPVGVVVSDPTSGEVRFDDWRGGHYLSEVLGGYTSDIDRSITFSFMDPTGGGHKAAVSRVAFRFGSTKESNNVNVKFYDVWGHEIIPLTADLAHIPEMIEGSRGFIAMQDGVEASLIHKVVFTSNDNDIWLIGSFRDSDTLMDMAFAGFQNVPEPSTLVLCLVGGLGLLLVGCRRRRKTEKPAA